MTPPKKVAAAQPSKLRIAPDEKPVAYGLFV
jgi:hypothetical protein